MPQKIRVEKTGNIQIDQIQRTNDAEFQQIEVVKQYNQSTKKLTSAQNVPTPFIGGNGLIYRNANLGSGPIPSGTNIHFYYTHGLKRAWQNVFILGMSVFS